MRNQHDEPFSYDRGLAPIVSVGTVHQDAQQRELRIRLARAKAAFTVRRVPRADMAKLLSADRKPRAGDLVLAVVEQLGQHNGLQLATGRRATLFVGDEIVVAYGNRYAPDQFEALVPEDMDCCDLVAGGGIAARSREQHRKMRAPTRIRPVGLLADANGNVINLERYALPVGRSQLNERIPVIAVVGTAMNAGKTTTATYLIRGLVKAGLRVGAAKLTGTGASGDTALMADAGASPVLDFTDAGLATTYLAGTDVVANAARSLLAHLAAADVDAIVVEIADGLLQKETAAMLSAAGIADQLSGFLFASPDAMGAVAGVEWLEQRGLPVLAVAGSLTQSPLAIREAREHTRLPVLELHELATPTEAMKLLDAGRRQLWSSGGSFVFQREAARV